MGTIGIMDGDVQVGSCDRTVLVIFSQKAHIDPGILHEFIQFFLPIVNQYLIHIFAAFQYLNALLETEHGLVFGGGKVLGFVKSYNEMIAVLFTLFEHAYMTRVEKIEYSAGKSSLHFCLI